MHDSAACVSRTGGVVDGCEPYVWDYRNLCSFSDGASFTNNHVQSVMVLYACVRQRCMCVTLRRCRRWL